MESELNYLNDRKKSRQELADCVPEFKPQYGNKYKTKTLREIAEHSNFFEIEIHPNIVSELIDRERLERANKFIKGKLEKLTTDELNHLQIEVNLMMFDEQIKVVEERLSKVEGVVEAEVESTPVSDASEHETVLEIKKPKKGKK